MLEWVMAKKHGSWLIAGASVGWVLGVWLALYFAMPFFTVIIGCILVVFAFLVRRRYAIMLAVLGTSVMGCWYGGGIQKQASMFSPLVGQVITVTGVVREDPSLDGSGSMSLQLQQLEVGGYQVVGAIWVSLGRQYDILRGDTVTMSGKLTAGFGNYVGTIYRGLVQEIVRPVPGDMGRVVRDWFASAVRLGIPEPQASLGIGFLTGQKSALPEDLAEYLRIAGLTHIVVASGYNLTILVRLARRLFKRHSLYLSTVSSGVMIASFVAVTGLSPSMTRAGLVAGLSLLLANYGRSMHPFVLLPFAAALTVAWQPSFAWGDMGWQLSFVAFAGVMIVAPLLQRYFFSDEKPGLVRQILGETVAAHLITIPIIVTAFGTISHVAVIANLLIVPLVPLAMLLTFIVGIIGLTAPMIVEFVALPATWLLHYMTETATFLAKLSWAQSDVGDFAWLTIPYAAGLIGMCVYMQRKTGFKLREVNLVD